jgi:hypothetical protein
MTEKRIQFSNIVFNQLPAYVREEFPLVAEFLSEYYRAQEFQGAPIDLIQNIDKYIKIDEITNQPNSVILNTDITSFDDTISVKIEGSPTGTNGFPEKYGLLKINNEIITYTGKTFNSFTGCIRDLVVQILINLKITQINYYFQNQNLQIILQEILFLI